MEKAEKSRKSSMAESAVEEVKIPSYRRNIAEDDDSEDNDEVHEIKDTQKVIINYGNKHQSQPLQRQDNELMIGTSNKR